MNTYQFTQAVVLELREGETNIGIKSILHIGDRDRVICLNYYLEMWMMEHPDRQIRSIVPVRDLNVLKAYQIQWKLLIDNKNPADAIQGFYVAPCMRPRYSMEEARRFISFAISQTKPEESLGNIAILHSNGDTIVYMGDEGRAVLMPKSVLYSHLAVQTQRSIEIAIADHAECVELGTLESDESPTFCWAFLPKDFEIFVPVDQIPDSSEDMSAWFEIKEFLEMEERLESIED